MYVYNDLIITNMDISQITIKNIRVIYNILYINLIKEMIILELINGSIS